MNEACDAVLFDLFGTLVDSGGEAVTGAAELLAALPAGRWAIVTSAPRALAEVLLARAALPAPAVLVTSDDVRANKPAPDGYLLAARLLGARPATCLVVEDSAPGVLSATAAGMRVVAVANGHSRAFPHGATVVDRLEHLHFRLGAGEKIILS